eukprot:scpid61290/ scgid21274/ 
MAMSSHDRGKGDARRPYDKKLPRLRGSSKHKLLQHWGRQQQTQQKSMTAWYRANTQSLFADTALYDEQLHNLAEEHETRKEFCTTTTVEWSYYLRYMCARFECYLFDIHKVADTTLILLLAEDHEHLVSPVRDVYIGEEYCSHPTMVWHAIKLGSLYEIDGCLLKFCKRLCLPEVAADPCVEGYLPAPVPCTPTGMLLEQNKVLLSSSFRKLQNIADTLAISIPKYRKPLQQLAECNEITQLASYCSLLEGHKLLKGDLSAHFALDAAQIMLVARATLEKIVCESELHASQALHQLDQFIEHGRHYLGPYHIPVTNIQDFTKWPQKMTCLHDPLGDCAVCARADMGTIEQYMSRCELAIANTQRHQAVIHKNHAHLKQQISDSDKATKSEQPAEHRLPPPSYDDSDGETFLLEVYERIAFNNRAGALYMFYTLTNSMRTPMPKGIIDRIMSTQVEIHIRQRQPLYSQYEDSIVKSNVQDQSRLRSLVFTLEKLAFNANVDIEAFQSWICLLKLHFVKLQSKFHDDTPDNSCADSAIDNNMPMENETGNVLDNDVPEEDQADNTGDTDITEVD